MGKVVRLGSPPLVPPSARLTRMYMVLVVYGLVMPPPTAPGTTKWLTILSSRKRSIFCASHSITQTWNWSAQPAPSADSVCDLLFQTQSPPEAAAGTQTFASTRLL